ncbi:RsiV family protein [Patescibacteria group bacterium]|nr:RsiV family protein [Patescibacteria group bacterium]MBU4022966.1 RsiV family protein [Patescibacteria group bacterium]MBU4078093.1 RsiV family protein [Patescibacteria group bacterium]
MSKIIKIVISIIIAITLLLIAYFVFQSNENGNKDTDNETNGMEEYSIIYTDGQSNFTLSLPKTWENYYTVETKIEEEIPSTIFNYLAENSTQALLLIVRAYPASTNIFAITSTPNTEIIAQTMESIFTLSQPLDVAFEQDGPDFQRYLEMVEQINEVAQSIKPNAEIYTLNQAIYEQDSNGRRHIDVIYPEIKNGKSFADINQIIKEEMEKFVSIFKQNLEEWGDVYIPEGAYSALYINYQLKSLDNDLASIYFTISENLAGAAHPNNYNDSLSFDLQTNKKIELNDLFKNEEQEYLARLSELVRADLKSQFAQRDMNTEESTLQSGTEPKAENFQNFNITTQGIVFNFGAYQIAAYAAGEFYSLIPYTQLQDILQEKFIQ